MVFYLVVYLDDAVDFSHKEETGEKSHSTWEKEEAILDLNERYKQVHVSWFIWLTKTFSLVHTFDLLEDKHVDDVTIDDMVLYIIYIYNK